jgi:hypothetical protein
MTKTEMQGLKKKVVSMVATKNGPLPVFKVSQIVNGKEGSLEAVLNKLRNEGLCRTYLSSDPFDDGQLMVVLTPEGLEYAGCIALEEAEDNWKWV